MFHRSGRVDLCRLATTIGVTGIWLLLSASALGQTDPQLLGQVGMSQRKAALFAGTLYPDLRSFTARSQSLMRAGLATGGHYAVRPIHQLLEPKGNAEAIALLQEGQAKLQQGFAAFRRNQAIETETLLTGAVTTFEQAVAVLEDFTPLVQAQQLLGMQLLKSGRDRDAIRWFKRALDLAPQSPLDPAVFPPDTVEIYERTRKQVGVESSKLSVTSDPAGAAIFLDNQFVGLTPANLSLKMAGRHLVRLTCDGFLPVGQPVELQSGRPGAIQLKLVPVKRKENFLQLVERTLAAAGDEDLMADSPISELNELLEVDELILIRTAPTQDGQVVLEGYHYDFLDGQLVNMGDALLSPRSADVDQEVTQFVDDLVSARLEKSLAGTIVLVKPPEDSKSYTGLIATAQEEAEPGSGQASGSLLKSPWLWVGVGGAAAAAGTAAVFLLAGAEEQEPTPPARGRLLFGFGE